MKDLTQGPVTRQLLSIASFLLIGMMVTTLYTLVDLFFVGALGPRSVAAVTLSTNLMMVALAFSQTLGVGTGALIAQSIGRKDFDHAHLLFAQALTMAAAAALVFETGAWCGKDAYVAAFAPDAETGQLAHSYLRWFLPSLALQFPMMAMGSALRGTGNMKPGTFAQIGSVLLNIVLAPILIRGWLGAPKLGVEGAGLATLLASVAAVVGLGLYFRRPQTFLKLRAAHCVPQFHLWWRTARIGLPSAMEFLVGAAYLLFVTATLQRFGPVQQAGFGIGQRLLQAFMLPAMAISFAASSMTGQNYGARLGDRVHATFRTTLGLSVGLMAIFCLMIQLFPTNLVGFFSTDPGVRAAGTDFLRAISFNLLAMGVAFSCLGVLTGLGNTWPTLASSVTRIILIVIPAWLLSHRDDFRVVWMWWLSVAATVVQMLMNLGFARREMRLRLDRAPAGIAPASMPSMAPANENR